MAPRHRRILLLNPNRYRYPPVIPLGIEYLAHALTHRGFPVEVLDLCFSESPLRDLTRVLQDVDPQAICITVRNVDSVLYPETEYFLPEIRDLIAHAKQHTRAPVIIGGSALSADPEGILAFLGADHAVLGPGEETLPRLLEQGDLSARRGRVVPGVPPESFCPERGRTISYGAYLQEQGLPGFETHKGCSSSCPYCMEAGTAVCFRDPAHVVCELKGLLDAGHDHLQLCDAEFNEDPEYCLSLLQAIAGEGLRFRWGLYMRPGHYSERLFELLSQSGAYLVTLSVDTLPRPPAYWKDVEKMIALCRDAGIRSSIDFLTGFPGEADTLLERSLDFFRRTAPDEVVVNVFLRLYKNLPIARSIEKDPSLRRYLIPPGRSHQTMLSPLFFNRIPLEELREAVGEDPLFRIAGAEKVVNYQKAP